MIGERLLTGIGHWFDERTVSQVFEPLIADWQRECGDAAGLSRAWCLARGGACLALTIALTWPRLLVAPLPRDGRRRAAMLTLAFIASGTALAATPLLAVAPVITADLLPAALAMAIPLAPLPAAILIARLPLPRWQQRVATARAATVCALVLVPLAGWITPSANQRWRHDVYAALDGPASSVHVPRGVRELSIGELAAQHAPADMLAADVHARPTELHGRLSLMLLPLTMAVMGVAAAGVAHRGMPGALFWWLVGAGAWIGSSRVGSPGFAAAWLPHVALAAMAVLMHMRSRSPLAPAAAEPQK